MTCTQGLAKKAVVHAAPPADVPTTPISQETLPKAIPGLPSLPLLGWRANVIGLLRDPVMSMLRLHRAYGDIVALGHERSAPICVFSPEYNHYILTNTDLFYSLDVNDSSAPIRMPRNTAASRLLSGVAGMNGENHTRHRRMLMPGFHKKRVDMLRDTIVARTEEHLAHWRVGQRVDLAHEMVYLSLSLAIGGLLGLDPDEDERDVRELLEQWGKHGLSAHVALLPFDVPGLPYHRFLKLSERLEAELYAVVARKRQNSLDNGDALSILLDAQDEDGSALTDTELLGHLTTLFTAGHETTASALTWTLFLLSQHPTVMADLMDELDSRLHGEAPTLEQVRDLPMLDHVINESLRMFPPGTWMIRTTTAPCELGPYELPKGTHLVYSPAVTHRNPDIYPEPDRFLPKRWESIDPSPYEFLPFGNGPRRCLGATYAIMELRVVLPMILQRFRPTVPPGARVDRAGNILSFPKGGLPVVLNAQDGQYTPANVRGNIHDLVRFS